MIFINEFAINRTELLINLRNASKQIINHLLKIFYHRSRTPVSHWKKEIFNYLHDIDLMKSNKKIPSEKLIFEGLWEGSYELFDGRHEDAVEDINEEYGKDFGYITYLSSSAENFCKEYMRWLARELSLKGRISKSDIFGKIDDLLNKYAYEENV